MTSFRIRSMTLCLSGCLYDQSSNRIAHIGASNMAGPLSDGCIVQAQPVND